MRMAFVGAWCLIIMLLARILAPIATVYLAPGTTAASESWRLIQFTADASAAMLFVAVAMLWSIKKQWRPGLWLSAAFSFGIVILSITNLVGFVDTINRPLVTAGSLLLPPPPEAKSFSEIVIRGLGNLTLAGNLSALLTIMSLLLPSLMLVLGLWMGLRAQKGATQ